MKNVMQCTETAIMPPKNKLKIRPLHRIETYSPPVSVPWLVFPGVGIGLCVEGCDCETLHTGGGFQGWRCVLCSVAGAGEIKSWLSIQGRFTEPEGDEENREGPR